MKGIETKRLELKVIKKEDVFLLKEYLERNRAFLSEWEPKREDAYYEKESLEELIQREIEGYENETLLSLYLSYKGEEKIIGNVALSNIVKGPFQSCFLGYKLDKDEINKGIITEAIEKVIEIAFTKYQLHRIEANIMPKNICSVRVVEKLGFEYEGLSKKYLRINNVWEDHAHYALLNPCETML